MHLHESILHQFALVDMRFLFYLVEKPLNFAKLKKK
jgi:hypothetical protein